MEKVKVAMMSFADINNYGDILFSHVIDMEFKKRIPSVEIDFFTPSTIDLEGFHYEGYSKDKIDSSYDCTILAGGEVVHLFDERTWNPIYNSQNKKVISNNASDTVWDWVTSSSKFKAWLSVGVRPFKEKWNKSLVDNTINELDYISCRGILSKKILEESDFEKFNSKIKLTPDLGWLFPQYLDYKKLRGKLYSNYILPDTNYLLFQVHNINDNEAELIASQLSDIKKQFGYEIVLMPVIHLWEDEVYLDKINKYSGGQFYRLPTNLTALEMLDIIVHAKLTITSSLHVAITALANGIPASVFNKWQGSKLQDLYGLQFRTELLISDVNSFFNTFLLLEKERTQNKSLSAYAEFMKLKLSEVFDELVDLILKSK